MVTDVPELLRTFHNPREAPSLELKHEKPEHRMMLYLKAQGKSNVEISELTGYHVVSISLIFRQRWAQDRLLEILNKEGRDRVGTLLEASAEDSIYTLIDIRDDSDAPCAVRKAAADSLLDRYLGKPKQQVEVTTHKGTDITTVEQWDARIASLMKEQNQLLGNTDNQRSQEEVKHT